MTGLDLITDKIKADAQKTADGNMEKAGQQAKTIEAEYKERMAEISEEAEKTRIETVNSMKERAENEKKVYLRSVILEEERKTAKSLIEAAKTKICEMPKEEYFAFLYDVFKNQCDLKKGEIVFSAEDKKNLPDDFLAKLGEAFKLADDDIKERGFIVRDGKVEVNCTIEAMFKSVENNLYDIACRKG